MKVNILYMDGIGKIATKIKSSIMFLLEMVQVHTFSMVVIKYVKL